MAKASTPTPGYDPWEKRLNEPAAAYSAFQAYLAIPPHSRTFKALAEKLGKTKSTLNNWSWLHGWKERALAWDNHCAKVAEEAHLEGLAAAKKEQAAIVSKMWRVAAKELEKLAAASEGSDKAVLSAKEIRMLATEAIKAHRLIHGESTENTTTTLKIPQVLDFGGVKVEF